MIFKLQKCFIMKIYLILQGLYDSEEFVQLRTLNCICHLCERDLLEKSTIYDLLNDVIPFSAHPVSNTVVN